MGIKEQLKKVEEIVKEEKQGVTEQDEEEIERMKSGKGQRK